jgi:hypothetical protein
MQSLNIEQQKPTQLFYVALALLALIVFVTAKQSDPGLVATGVVLVLVSAYPFYFWLLGWSQGLPIWPVFAMVNGVTAALPIIQDPVNLDAYTPGEIVVGAMTMAGFIILGTAVWLAMSAAKPKPPKTVWMIAREHSERYLFGFILAGLIFQINQLGGWIVFPGNTMQVVRGITMALNTMGIFVLAFYDGRRLLSRPQSLWLMVLAALTALAGAAGLILATAVVPVAMLLMGYTLGAGRIPWRSLLVVFTVAAVLHPGKYAMRELYWGPDRPAFHISMMPQFYWDWFGNGLQHIGDSLSADGKKEEESRPSSLFERSGNLHMLLLVQRKSPDEVPFLNGITYEPIPRLLVPRFLDQDKGFSHAGNVMLTVNYGLQTLEQTRSTSIAWGLVPEAYANFGFVGVAGLAVALGIFYAYVTRLSAVVPMTSLRFVLGLLILGAATKADTMGVFITQQFQGVVGVMVAALFLMRREHNPLADIPGAFAPSRGTQAGRLRARQRGAAPAAAFFGNLPVAANHTGAGPLPEGLFSGVTAPHAPVGGRALPRWSSRRQKRAAAVVRESASSQSD